MIDPKFILRYTNQHAEVFYFVAHGAMHGAIKMIDSTTSDLAKATRFDLAPDAAIALHDAGGPPGWEIVPVEK